MASAPATGMIAWVGLAAADAAAAIEFYTAAFDWEAAPGTDHTKLRRAGRDMALVYQQTPQARAANVTSHWSPFFLVADADLTMERAVQLNGMALRDPFDVTGGRVVPLQDPVGAVFSVWAPRPPDPPEPSPSGAWWIELSTSDVEASRAFYGDLLGWRYDETGDAASIRAPDDRIGRINRGQGHAAWSPCARVTDVETAGRRAEEAGAAVVGAPEETAVGRIVRIVDPQGAAFSLLEPACQPPR
jgi:uncharacterized protein